MNRNIGRAILAYILSLISPAISPTIAQAQPGDTTKPEGDWVIQSERPRAVAEAGERDLRSQPIGKARIGIPGEQDVDATAVWGRKPDGKDGRQSEGASRGTSPGVDRVSKSEPIAASGAISKDSGTGGRKSDGGSSGDRDSGDRDTGDGGGDRDTGGDGGTGGTGDGGGGGTGSGGTGERGAGDSGTGDGSTGGRSTGDRDGGSGGSGGGGNSGGRDR